METQFAACSSSNVVLAEKGAKTTAKLAVPCTVLHFGALYCLAFYQTILAFIRLNCHMPVNVSLTKSGQEGDRRINYPDERLVMAHSRVECCLE